jgi:hypothetical protein
MAGPFIVASTNGTKARLDDLPEDAWRIFAGPDERADGPGGLYRLVPVLYRGAMLRADAIAGMPYDLMPLGSDEPIEKPETALPWLSGWQSILREVELNQVVWGRSYLLKGMARGAFSVRKLHPPTIRPKFDPQAGLTHFERVLGDQTQRLPLKNVCYVWQPNPQGELGPGPAPATVAMLAGGVLNSIDVMAKVFFERGAILTTVLGVEGNPAPEELRRLERWWKGLVGGVKKAMETVAVRASVKPVVVGAPPKDLALPELTEAKRIDVALALGVPMSLLWSTAANFATAQTDRLSFYEGTIVPESELLEEALNAQLFGPLGYSFTFKPERLEVFEAKEAEKAFALVPAAQAQLMSIPEWRKLMGLPPEIEGPTLEPAPTVEVPDRAPGDKKPGGPKKALPGGDEVAALPEPFRTAWDDYP